MFKKLNTTTLIIILIVLSGIVWFSKYQSQKSESTFRTEFVNVDTGAVTQILIYPKAEKGKEIKIIKTSSGWELQNDKVKTSADTNAIHGLLANFVKVKSVSLAAENKSGWKDLQVEDTSGTRIKILTKDNQKYDMIVGKFGYNQQARNGLTYIRHADEEQVYVIDGFLSFTVNQGFNMWRRKTFISGNKDNWNSLTFTYPSDSSFVLTKQNNAWMINGMPADSAKTIQYLSTISNLQNSSFVDGYSPASTAVFSLTINGNNQSPITVLAYPADTTQKYILHSSLNADAYFSEAQSHIGEQVFVGKEKFLKRDESVPKK